MKKAHRSAPLNVDKFPRSGKETSVFLDTSVLYALRVKGDQLHEQATATVRELCRDAVPLYIIYHVVLEAYRLLLYEHGTAAAHSLIRDLHDLRLFNLWYPTQEEVEAAEERVLRFSEEISLTDAIVAEVARRWGASVCCYDWHYQLLDVRTICIGIKMNS